MKDDTLPPRVYESMGYRFTLQENDWLVLVDIARNPGAVSHAPERAIRAIVFRRATVEKRAPDGTWHPHPHPARK